MNRIKVLKEEMNELLKEIVESENQQENKMNKTSRLESGNNQLKKKPQNKRKLEMKGLGNQKGPLEASLTNRIL